MYASSYKILCNVDALVNVTSETIAEQYQFLLDNADRYVDLVNRTRDSLGSEFGTDVESITIEEFHAEVDHVFEDADLAINVAALMAILQTIDTPADHPAFIVDDILGRQLAATIAGREPRVTLATATFHYVDITQVNDHGTAGQDDLDAGITAGIQTRLPGWPWQTADRPFAPPQ